MASAAVCLACYRLRLSPIGGRPVLSTTDSKRITTCFVNAISERLCPERKLGKAWAAGQRTRKRMTSPKLPGPPLVVLQVKPGTSMRKRSNFHLIQCGDRDLQLIRAFNAEMHTALFDAVAVGVTIDGRPS